MPLGHLGVKPQFSHAAQECPEWPKRAERTPRWPKTTTTNALGMIGTTSCAFGPAGVSKEARASPRRPRRAPGRSQKRAKSKWVAPVAFGPSYGPVEALQDGAGSPWRQNEVMRAPNEYRMAPFVFGRSRGHWGLPKQRSNLAGRAPRGSQAGPRQTNELFQLKTKRPT